MSFLETPRFPVTVSWGATASPRYSTSIVRVNSGKDKRNQIWTYPLNHYNVASGVQSQTTLEDLIEFFHVAAGQAYGFRFKDRWDWKSCGIDSTPSSTDQVIATQDATGAVDFQLIKTYTKGASTRTRKIQKPVSGTVLVSVDGADQTEGVDVSVDTITGIITFASGAVPIAGQVIRAGYEFDTPCRFETDEISIVLTTYRAGSATVPLTEIRL